MQVVSATTIDSANNNNRKPSAKLQEKIRNCVSMFRSLNETVNEVIEMGKTEGFSPREIGQFIREEMLKSGLSRRTVTNYLPAELKAKPRGIQVKIREKFSQNENQNENQGQGQKQIREKFSLNQVQRLLTDDIDIEAFSTAAKHLKTETLGKVIDHLAQVYNERTGQKIKVIFRKMIEDDTTKDKKYQPSIDEVKQRENKVISLVKEGIFKISELVEQSGVSDSATRRYLQKAGYKVTFGTISH